ncbi:hypothetical protein SLA2020_417280 [Shorea laevis]
MLLIKRVGSIGSPMGRRSMESQCFLSGNILCKPGSWFMESDLYFYLLTYARYIFCAPQKSQEEDTSFDSYTRKQTQEENPSTALKA